MSSCTMKRYTKDNGRDPYNYRQGIKIQNSSTKGRVSEEGRTTLWDCTMGKESDTPMRIKLPA